MPAVPFSRFQTFIEVPADGVEPTAIVGGMGVEVTPGFNTPGAFVELLDSIAARAYDVEITIHGDNTVGGGQEALVDLFLDLAGGTNYTTPFVEGLQACDVATPQLSTTGGAAFYRLPCTIPAGASLAARAQMNRAVPTPLYVSAKLFCDPTVPTALRTGTYIRTFGKVGASSRGTVIVPGTAGADGAWTEIGTVADADLFYFDYGISADDAAMNANVYHTDIAVGDAGTKRIVIENAAAYTSTAEKMMKLRDGGFGEAAIGEKIYARCQVGGNAAETTTTITVYGVGGNLTDAPAQAVPEPAASTATTATAIRDALAAAIVALVPTILPTRLFRKYDKTLDFEEAMKQGPAHSFRVFQCRFDKESGVPITRNGTNQRWRYLFHVDVAYPAKHYDSLDIPVLELDTAEDEDQRLIQDAIWNVENATWIKSGSEPSPTSETVDGVTYVRHIAMFEFIRAMP